jgi:diaminopimelate epimerase
MRLVKGHGTENDFLVLPDLGASIDLTPELVRALCDRHGGLGADGVLRVVRSDNHPEAKEMAAEAPYFMDYRNADGSTAEMCGNGIRVFLRYLIAASLVGQDAAVATRGGIRRVQARGDGDVTVEMGQPRVLADRPVATAAFYPPRPARDLTGTAVEMPNPHVVVFLDDSDDLAALDLRLAPAIRPSLPGGQNVEFVLRRGERHLQLRVHERGVGETRSCGTGICAAAVAAAHGDGVAADGGEWRVDVPGGSCGVRWRTDGEIELTGPAVLLAEIDVDPAWLAAVGACR